MSLLTFLNQTVVYYPKVGQNKYGEEQDGSTIEIQVRFRKQIKQVRLPNGEMRTIDAIIIAHKDPGWSIDDRIDYDTVTYRIFSIKEAVDGQGQIHHVTVQLQKSVL